METMKTQVTETEEAIQHLKAAMQDTHIIMLTTANEEGEMQSRPMAVQDVEFDGYLWFFTSHESGKVSQSQTNNQVNVAFVDTKNNLYLSASGTVIVVDNMAKKEEMWSKPMEIYFPKGVTDPNLALLRVSVTSIAWWTGASTVLGRVVSFLKTWAQKDASEIGESGAAEIA
jgi:general stress protein 26